MSTQKRRYEMKARAEAQEATRAKIAAAAAALHEEQGIAATTIAEIARRAGVQRLTVYNHFPDLDTLLPACTAHWMAAHPLPDLDAVFAIEDAEERVRAALTALYAWYRDGATMQRRVLGERSSVPELETWLACSRDVTMAELAAGLAAGLPGPHTPALVALATDFWTWDRLQREGLADDEAAALMAGVAAGRC